MAGSLSEEPAGPPARGEPAPDVLAALPDASLPGQGARVLVVTPHPDDETIGVGGTLALLAGRGVRVALALVTDGEDADPKATPAARDALVVTRRAELGAALAALGHPEAPVHRLGLPDRRVAEHEPLLVRRLRDLLIGPEAGATWVLAPHRHDGHRDHEAAARATVAATAWSGHRLAAYAVWWWHRGADRPDLSGATAVRLDAAALAAKSAALAAYTSQTTGPHPVVPPELVERAAEDTEVLWWPGGPA